MAAMMKAGAVNSRGTALRKRGITGRSSPVNVPIPYRNHRDGAYVSITPWGILRDYCSAVRSEAPCVTRGPVKGANCGPMLEDLKSSVLIPGSHGSPAPLIRKRCNPA